MTFDNPHNTFKNHPSYIDRQFYENRLMEKANQTQEKAIKGLTDEDFLNAIISLEDKSFEALVGNISYHLPEAKAIIKSLDNSEKSDERNQNLISWEPIFKQRNSEKNIISREMTYSEMIDRLQEISNEEFGFDIHEWNKWLAAWELYPVPTGNR